MVLHTQVSVANAPRIEMSGFTMRACLPLGMVSSATTAK